MVQLWSLDCGPKASVEGKQLVNVAEIHCNICNSSPMLVREAEAIFSVTYSASKVNPNSSKFEGVVGMIGGRPKADNMGNESKIL